MSVPSAPSSGPIWPGVKYTRWCAGGITALLDVGIVRLRVAARRESWFESRYWVYAFGGADCAEERNCAAIWEADGVLVVL